MLPGNDNTGLPWAFAWMNPAAPGQKEGASSEAVADLPPLVREPCGVCRGWR